MPTTTSNPNGPLVDAARQPPLGTAVVDAVVQESARAAEQTRHLWAQGGDQVQATLGQLRRDAEALRERTRDQVREQPLKAVLVAAAAGAALAGLLSLAWQRRS